EGFATDGVDADDARLGPFAGGELALRRVMKDDHSLQHLCGFAGAVAVRMPAFRENGEFMPEAGRVTDEQTLRLTWCDCQDLRSREGLEERHMKLCPAAIIVVSTKVMLVVDDVKTIL